MNANQTATPAHTAPLPPSVHQSTNPPIQFLTLDPIRTEGPDALAPDPPDDIVSVKLSRLDLIWEDAYHQATTKTADDLFQCPDANGLHDDPLPRGAEPVRVVLKIQFNDAPAPHAVDIAPPHTLNLEYPADAPRVTAFLSRRHFTLTGKLASLLVLLLALAGATIPDLDDDTDDDDDETDPRLQFAT